jgi:hypothetical protein
MLFNKQTSYDENLRVSVAQNITADDVGKDAGNNPIVLDVENWRGQALQVNLSIQAAGANTDVVVYAESSDSATFASGVFTDEVLNVNETTAVTAPKKYGPAGFVPKGKYARIRYDHTSGSLTGATAWLSTTH